MTGTYEGGGISTALLTYCHVPLLPYRFQSPAVRSASLSLCAATLA
jgi:hypothetical protein